MNKAKVVEVVEKAMKNDHLMSQPIVDPQYPHFWTYTSNLTTVVNSVLKFMISGTTSILKS